MSNKWKYDELARLISFVEKNGRKWERASCEVGRSANACRTAYFKKTITVDGKICPPPNLVPWRATSRTLANDAGRAIVRRDRQRVSELGMCLTARLLGDPPPGRSALDMMRAEESASRDSIWSR
jgi:hypothetical protein